MTPELWQRLKPLFHAAMERDPNTRAGFAAELCGTDTELKEQLLRLLDANAKGIGPIDRPAVDPVRLAEAAAIRFHPGQILLDRFRIVRLLGKGGMGEVFEAQDLQTGRIALKTIRADIATSPQIFARFRREVQLARKVSGPQICRIHELFVLPEAEGSPATAFLTMEFLEGMTLRRKLAGSGPLNRNEALPIALDICEGLRLIHEQGIVHRDLKAANIMLCNRAGKSRAVVMDFGLAWLDASAPIAADAPTLSEVPSQTAHGVLAGTPAYMAPEQFEGKPVSPATDIYALGVVLYELVTGRQPYAADTPVAAAIRHARRPDPVSSIRRHIPRHWDRVIARCLEYDPEKRFQQAGEVAAALRSSPLRLHNIRKDHPRLMGLAAAGVLALLGLWAASWWRSMQYYRPDAEANRWYQNGLSALREGSYLRATRELSNAVARDQRFVMAHARLAEAWANLDFDGVAQREMLIASAGESRVPPLDRMYLDAIRDTLTRDFKGALDLYRRILDRLPQSGKASGYLDVGMAYERVGDPQDALANYAKASSRDADNPAPWLRAGMLQTRLNHVPEANEDFARAQDLYAAEMNWEGQAELDYQRGYLASLRGDLAGSMSYLQRSTEEGKAISSPQLQIRALTQMSSIECASGHLEQAVADANSAVQLAGSRQLDTWAAMALAWLANAHLNQGPAHFAEADSELTDARDLAAQSQQGRALALANLVLASLRDSQHRWAEVIAPATDALAYYRANGYFANAANARLLLLRATPVTGDLELRLKDAQDFSNLAENSGSSYLRGEADHALGNAYELLERYPDALQQFSNAVSLAGSATNRGYEVIAMSAVLVRLGQIPKARAYLASLPADPAYRLDLQGVQADALLAQAQYPGAYRLSARVLHENADLPQDERREFENRLAIAAAHLGRSTEALASFTDIPAGNTENEADRAYTALQRLEMELWVGQRQTVLSSVDGLAGYLESQSLYDSALRADLIAAAAAGSTGTRSKQALFTQKAVDNLTKLKHTWGLPAVLIYLSRPDLHALILMLPPRSQAELSG